MAQPYESTPVVAIEDVKGVKKITAIGRDAEALKGKAGVELVNPFAHPRLILGDFTIAEKLLQLAVRSFLKGQWLALVVLGIVHPERQMEGGLTQIERRALLELCENVGCRKAVVHEGRALSSEEVANYEFRT